MYKPRPLWYERHLILVWRVRKRSEERCVREHKTAAAFASAPKSAAFASCSERTAAAFARFAT